MKKENIVIFIILSFLFVMQLPLWSFSSVAYKNKDIKFGFIDNQFVIAVSTRTGILNTILRQSTLLSKRKSLLRISLIEGRVMYNENSIPSHFPKNERGNIHFMPENIQKMRLNGEFEKLSSEKRRSIDKYFIKFNYDLYLKEICNEKDRYAIIRFVPNIDVSAYSDYSTEYTTQLRNIFNIKNIDDDYYYNLSGDAYGYFKIKDKMAKNIGKNPIPLDFSRTSDYEFYFVDRYAERGEKETKMEPLSSVELKNCRAL